MPTSTIGRDRVLSGPASARVTLDGREYINFAGCAYLALGRLRELREAASSALEGGVGFSCQLPSAYGVADPTIRDLEVTAAAYCGTEDAVYFASGYLIGAAALTSLDTGESVLFLDESAHFSLWDAARLSTRRAVPFGHCDPDALSRAIRQNLPARMRPIVMTDGVFGTTGRVAPLEQYAGILAPYEGRLLIDEAHSFGVLGPHGRGAVDHHGVESISATAATLSKAFCAQGAIIGCSHEAADRLRCVPPLRVANSGSPISAAVAAAAIRYVQAHPERRERLSELATYLRNRLKGIGIEIEAAESPAPILAFRIADHATMESIQRRLMEQGIYVMLSNYIGAGASGILRCAVFADHCEADLDELVDALAASSRPTDPA
jgi:8-amino-7-oxononanoate synthase